MNSPSTSVLPVASPRTTALATVRLLARQRCALASTTVLLLVGAASALVIPPALGQLVDLAIEGRGFGLVALVCLVVLAAGMVSAGATWWGGRLLVACLQDALSQLREDVFEAAVGRDSGTIERAGTSDVVSRVTGDVEAVTEAVSGVLPRVVGALFTIALTAVGLAVLDPWLAAAALLAIPLQACSTVLFLRRSRPLYVSMRHQEASRGQVLIEAVAGAETVRAHDRAGSHLQLIADRSLAAVGTQVQQVTVRNSFFAGLNTAEFIGLGAVLAAGYWRVDAGAITAGAVTAAALFFHRLFGPIGALLTSIDDLQRAQAGLERLVGALQAVRPAEDSQEIADASVEIDGVGFSYSGDPDARRALDDVDLHLAAGSTTVLVGASGSGKSTLARLIAGTLDPDTGSIRIGGATSTAARSRSRPAVLLATQEAHLFTGTVADNLRLARPDAADSELIAALEAVGAHWGSDADASGVLANIPRADLDEARIQQIALARVLLADPPVVVLDEATADAGSDGTLDRAVAAVVAGRTALIVAHRLVHTEHADLIVVMEDGRIQETGGYTELVDGEGTFARLWDAWNHEGDTSDDAGSLVAGAGS